MVPGLAGLYPEQHPYQASGKGRIRKKSEVTDKVLQ
jgi:hypothetical protein